MGNKKSVSQAPELVLDADDGGLPGGFASGDFVVEYVSDDDDALRRFQHGGGGGGAGSDSDGSGSNPDFLPPDAHRPVPQLGVPTGGRRGGEHPHSVAHMGSSMGRASSPSGDDGRRPPRPLPRQLQAVAAAHATRRSPSPSETIQTRPGETWGGDSVVGDQASVADEIARAHAIRKGGGGFSQRGGVSPHPDLDDSDGLETTSEEDSEEEQLPGFERAPGLHPLFVRSPKAVGRKDSHGSDDTLNTDDVAPAPLQSRSTHLPGQVPPNQPSLELDNDTESEAQPAVPPRPRETREQRRRRVEALRAARRDRKKQREREIRAIQRQGQRARFIHKHGFDPSDPKYQNRAEVADIKITPESLAERGLEPSGKPASRKPSHASGSGDSGGEGGVAGEDGPAARSGPSPEDDCGEGPGTKPEGTAAEDAESVASEHNALEVLPAHALTNEALGLPPDLATIVTYHGGPIWQRHSTIALQHAHGPAVLLRKVLYLVDPRFASVGLWTGVCHTPTCFPLQNKLQASPCFPGPGSDSMASLQEDCRYRKLALGNMLRTNAALRTKTNRELAAIEGDKDDAHWYGMRMYDRPLFDATMKERARLRGVLEFLDEQEAKLAAEDESNDKDAEAFASRRGLRTAFQVKQADKAVITGIAVDYVGTIWCVDAAQRTITSYHQSGVLIREIPPGNPALWSHPYAIATNNSEKSIVISNSPPPESPQYGEGALVKYTLKGELLGASSNSLPIKEPTCITVDEANQLLFVGDSALQTVWVLHSTGLYIVRQITSLVSVVNKFSGLASLVYTPDTSHLYILDRARLEVHNVEAALERGVPVVEHDLEVSLPHPPGSSGRVVAVHWGDSSSRRKVLVLQ